MQSGPAASKSPPGVPSRRIDVNRPHTKRRSLAAAPDGSRLRTS